MDLLVHINPEGVEKNINPLDHGSALHTDVMRPVPEAASVTPVRRRIRRPAGTKKSHAPRSVFSLGPPRTAGIPRPAPRAWNLYNGRKKGESIRVFPPRTGPSSICSTSGSRSIVPLYFAAERPVVERDGC